jgi:hypothetical protein
VLQRLRQQRNRGKMVLEKQGLLPAVAVTTAHPKSAKKARQIQTAHKLVGGPFRTLMKQLLTSKGRIKIVWQRKD